MKLYLLIYAIIPYFGCYDALVAMKKTKHVRFQEPARESKPAQKNKLARENQDVFYPARENKPAWENKDVFHLARSKSTLCIMLLAPFINLNEQEKSTGNTILHYCVLLNDEKTIKELLSTQNHKDPKDQARLNIHVKNSCGHTAFELAQQSGNAAIYDLLEKYHQKNNPPH